MPQKICFFFFITRKDGSSVYIKKNIFKKKSEIKIEKQNKNWQAD